MKLPLNSKRAFQFVFFFNLAITYIEISLGKLGPTLMKSTRSSQNEARTVGQALLFRLLPVGSEQERGRRLERAIAERELP